MAITQARMMAVIEDGLKAFRRRQALRRDVARLADFIRHRHEGYTDVWGILANIDAVLLEHQEDVSLPNLNAESAYFGRMAKANDRQRVYLAAQRAKAADQMLGGAQPTNARSYHPSPAHVAKIAAEGQSLGIDLQGASPEVRSAAAKMAEEAQTEFEMKNWLDMLQRYEPKRYAEVMAQRAAAAAAQATTSQPTAPTNLAQPPSHAQPSSSTAATLSYTVNGEKVEVEIEPVPDVVPQPGEKLF